MPVRTVVALIAIIGFVSVLAPAEALAQADSVQAEPGDQSAPVYVAPAPGGGYWLVLADGQAVPIGTEISVPSDDALAELAELADSPPAVGQLAGVVARQYLGGQEENIQLACTGDLSLEARLGQTLMSAFDSQELALAADPLASGLIGGVVVLGSPTAEIAGLITDLRSQASIYPLFAVDEEGGRVQRLRDVLGRLPAAQTQALQNTPAELRELIAAHGRGVRALGFDLNFAPVLDVGGGPGIGDRAYGDDPTLVTEYGLAVVAGLEDAGLVSVVKHFPGHGRASVDSHVDLATTPPFAELNAVDLVPFRAAVDGGVSAVMVGHLDVPGLTGGMPASLSPEAVEGLLRGDLGFEGLVISDALNMGAITLRWSTAEAVELALIAGVDLALLGDADELDAIHSAVGEAVAVGRLSEQRVTEAASRVLAAKNLDTCVLLAEAL